MCLLTVIHVSGLAHQIDEADKTAAKIKRYVSEYSDSVVYKLAPVYSEISATDLNDAPVFFDRLSQSAAISGDEKIQYCASLAEAVYYIDKKVYNKALTALSKTETFAHNEKETAYVNFLKGLCHYQDGGLFNNPALNGDIVIQNNVNENNNGSPFDNIVLYALIALVATSFTVSLLKKKPVKQPCEINTVTAFSAFAAVAKDRTEAVSLIEPDGKLRWINKGFEKLYGFDREEFILNYGNNVFSCAKLSERGNAAALCLNDLQPHGYTAVIRKSDEKDVWVKGIVSPYTENGELTGLLAVESDVSDIKSETGYEKKINSMFEGSLRNASYIQKIMLPKKADVSKVFNNFIIYKPKNFVSGDFYWFAQTGGSYVFALGDCIGHGLSGSLLSVLSIKNLEEIILTENVLSPKEVLNQMDNRFRKTFGQDGALNGLDMTICRITLSNSGADITVSGARSYFFYYSDGKTTMLRGTKRSLGEFEENTEFENSDISLKKGDFIYFSSDGIIDQNDAKRKPLGRQRFFNIIDGAAKCGSEMYLQEEYIEKQFEEFSSGQPQRDDICVVGIKI